MGMIDDLVNLIKKYSTPKKEEMISYEVVYEPNTKDAHGHWMSEQTLQEACDNFNANLSKGIVKSNLCHILETESFVIEKTWIAPELDVVVEETGQPIKAGTWIAKLQFTDPDVWELKKSGILGGVSIGGRGVINEETGEITKIDFSTPLGGTVE